MFSLKKKIQWFSVHRWPVFWISMGFNYMGTIVSSFWWASKASNVWGSFFLKRVKCSVFCVCNHLWFFHHLTTGRKCVYIICKGAWVRERNVKAVTIMKDTVWCLIYPLQDYNRLYQPIDVTCSVVQEVAKALVASSSMLLYPIVILKISIHGREKHPPVKRSAVCCTWRMTRLMIDVCSIFTVCELSS